MCQSPQRDGRTPAWSHHANAPNTPHNCRRRCRINKTATNRSNDSQPRSVCWSPGTATTPNPSTPTRGACCPALEDVNPAAYPSQFKSRRQVMYNPSRNDEPRARGLFYLSRFVFFGWPPTRASAASSFGAYPLHTATSFTTHRPPHTAVARLQHPLKNEFDKRNVSPPGFGGPPSASGP